MTIKKMKSDLQNKVLNTTDKEIIMTTTAQLVTLREVQKMIEDAITSMLQASEGYTDFNHFMLDLQREILG